MHLNGRRGLWRVADLPTTRAGVERAFSYFIAGVRLGTVAQMVPAVQIGASKAPNDVAYIACWAAAAAAAVAVSVVTLVRRRPLGAAASTVDFALACLLLVLGPVALTSGDRFGTWVAFQPGYALSVIITASGVRSLTVWAGGLLGIAACYVVYLGGQVRGEMIPTAIGNVLTYVVYALVARMFFVFIRRIAHDADASRARAAELARRQEERRGQVMMHNGVALMRLLTEPASDEVRARLIDQADVELQRMRSYLRGQPSHEDGSSIGGSAAAQSSVGLVTVAQRVCERYADLNVHALLDLGAGLKIPIAQAHALERALESLMLNVRMHARASEVVVHLDSEPGWTLTVRDDGVGFDPATVTTGVGLREVVVGELRLCGFGVAIESAPGEGTTVTIRSAGDSAPVRAGTDVLIGLP